jgi:hypothetical protein
VTRAGRLAEGDAGLGDEGGRPHPLPGDMTDTDDRLVTHNLDTGAPLAFSWRALAVRLLAMPAGWAVLAAACEAASYVASVL